LQSEIQNPKSKIFRTLFLALGNPILSDDAVGWEIADRLERILPPGAADFMRESGATLDLIPKLTGYDRLVILDAIQLGQAPAGTLYRFTLDDFRSTVRHSSAHDLNFATAFDVGRRLGYAIPADIRVYAIEVQELRRFAEGCTPAVASRLDALAEEIRADIVSWGKT
jgi:hydrogenase maturation protease